MFIYKEAAGTHLLIQLLRLTVLLAAAFSIYVVPLKHFLQKKFDKYESTDMLAVAVDSLQTVIYNWLVVPVPKNT